MIRHNVVHSLFHQISKDMAKQANVSDVLSVLLSGVRSLAHADGATVYLLDRKQRLHFFIIQNESLAISSEKDPNILTCLKSIPLYCTSGEMNQDSIAAVSVANKEIIHVKDIYHSTYFDSKSARNFDQEMSYKTKSIVAIPMMNHRQEVIGVLELINHLEDDGQLSDFSDDEIASVEILLNQASMQISNHNLQRESDKLMDGMSQMNRIGIALSAEHDLDRLLEFILDHAKELTGADGGTLYLYEEGQLHYEVMRTDSLDIYLSRSAGNLDQMPPIQIHDAQGRVNEDIVAAYAAAYTETLNIPHVYADSRFNFTKVKAFDVQHNYQTVSMLAVPMVNQKKELIGVLQLINARDTVVNATESFSAISQELAEALASLAAVAISNKRLNDELAQLIEAFINVISTAIDEKSAYTGGHCRRVPDLSMMLIEEVSFCQDGIFADFSLTEESMYEMRIASMLHDCGKITTPIHIVDKATKLEKIFDRIELIALRYEIVRRDALLNVLREQPQLSFDAAEASVQELWQRLKDDLAFLRTCNIGAEYMAAEKQDRVRRIAELDSWVDMDDVCHKMLCPDEVMNLNIAKGTLNQEDREIINYHITATIHMLEALPFPKHLKNVPEIAGGHHERMDGKGYPKGLTRDQMSIQARVIGVVDVFEALTACDRPYRKAMPLSRALAIMQSMKEEGHLDPDLFDLFKETKVYLRYAKKFLDASQIDVQ